MENLKFKCIQLAMTAGLGRNSMEFAKEIERYVLGLDAPKTKLRVKGKPPIKKVSK